MHKGYTTPHLINAQEIEKCGTRADCSILIVVRLYSQMIQLI